MFECCQPCKPPKRRPGGHDHCPEYKKAREEYDERKTAIDRQRQARNALYSQRKAGIRKAVRKSGKKHIGGDM